MSQDLTELGTLGGAGMGTDNRVVLVLYELLEIFKLMMKQLKLTQKELKKARKEGHHRDTSAGPV